MTLSAIGCSAEPLVENDSIATRGSTSSRARQVSADAMAISASCEAVGLITTAGSAKIIAPSTPNSLLGATQLVKLPRVAFELRRPAMIEYRDVGQRDAE